MIRFVNRSGTKIMTQTRFTALTTLKEAVFCFSVTSKMKFEKKRGITVAPTINNLQKSSAEEESEETCHNI